MENCRSDSLKYLVPVVYQQIQPWAFCSWGDNDNFSVFRYSLTLLLQAEALNELSRTAEANAYVSRVRKRAGLAELPASLSQDAFREAVYHELQVELAFENWRWSDLLRTDQVLQAMKEHGENRNKGALD